jgi:hypothetical protein
LWFDPLGLMAVAIREFMTEYHGVTTWDESNRKATFSANGKTLTTGVYAGSKDDVTYWNEKGHIFADDSSLIAFFFGVPKNDQAKGVEVTYIDNKYYKDVTKPVQAAVFKAEPDFRKHRLDGLWFMDQVKKEAVWDIKVSESWTRTIGTTFPGVTIRMILMRERLDLLYYWWQEKLQLYFTQKSDVLRLKKIAVKKKADIWL